MSKVKAVSLEELLKEINDLDVDFSKTDLENWKRVFKEKFEAFVAGLRDLRNEFPSEFCNNGVWMYDALDVEKWLDKVDVALEGAKEVRE